MINTNGLQYIMIICSIYSQSDDLETAMTSMKCGSVEVPPAPLITNGQNTARGQWPWHIALYKIEGINLSYSCGGSLISSTAVITGKLPITQHHLLLALRISLT